MAVNYASQPDAATQVVERIHRLGRAAFAIQADVGSENDIERMFEKVRDAWRTLDVFVNNAMELAPLSIAVNAVCAGPVDTNALRAFSSYQRIKEQCERRTAWRRLGTPEDVARVVAFLSSDEARWIVGQTIVADGGVSLLSGIDSSEDQPSAVGYKEDLYA